ncbi:MAG: hypothetical protein NVSMB28_04780 [Collimonas sp.]
MYATEEFHLSAYNAAFYELGLRWHWDTDTYHALQHNACEKERIRVYLQTNQPHLLKAYDADFLIDAIQNTKARCYETIIASGSCAAPEVDWAAIQAIEVGV